MKYNQFTVILLLFNFGYKCIAQQNIELQSTKLFTVDEGLSQNLIWCMLHDASGFLWLGTNDGLNRYDGFEIKQFHHDPLTEKSMPGNRIYSIFQSKNHWIWVGSNAGLVVYDPKTDQLLRIESTEFDITKAIYSIVEDPFGSIWLATLHNVFKITFTLPLRYLPSLKYRVELVTSYSKAFHDQSEIFLDLAVSSDANVYLVNAKGLFQTKASNGIEKQKNFRQINGIPGKNLVIDHNGYIWYGNSTLNKYDPHSNTTHNIPLLDNLAESMLNQYTSDKAGNIWFTAKLNDGNNALFKVDICEHSIVEIKKKTAFPATCLTFSQKDILWLGTPGHGVERLDLRSSMFQILPSITSQVKDFREVKRQIFVPSCNPTLINHHIDDRITKKNLLPEASKSNIVTLNSGSPLFFNSTFPHTAIRTTNGNYWAHFFDYNSQKGYLVLHDSLFKPIKKIHVPECSTSHIRFMTSSDELWLLSGYNLLKIALNTMITEVNPIFTDKVSFHHNTLLPSIDGLFWIGTSIGLTKFKPFTKDIIHINEINSCVKYPVISLADDPNMPNKFLWIGTEGGGLIKLNKLNGDCTQYTKNNGLPNMVIYGILADKKNILWISTNNGLVRFDPEIDKMDVFTKDDGLPSNEFNRTMYGKVNDDRFWFETTKGIIVFSPSEVSPNVSPPELALIQIRSSNKVIDPNIFPQYITNTAIYASHITLPYYENTLTFQYAAFDFRVPHQTLYQVKLEGVDKDWINVGPERSATYSNLKPGNYKFCVIGANSHGYWNQEGRSIKLKILNPWWQSIWAYLVYLTIISALVYYIYLNRSQRLKLKYGLHTERMEAQKLSELNAMKNHFFSNITHEFRTPVTLIINPVERLLTKSEKPEIIKELGRIHRNAQQLLQLINQLLELGKIDSGMMKLDFKYGDIVRFVYKIYDTFVPLAESKNIDLEFSTQKESKFVNFDPIALEVIMFNILSNAVKYTPQHGSIFTSIEFTEIDNTEWLYLDISDSGKGLTEEEKNHIFDRYYRGEDTDTQAGEGTGIGLALVKEYIELWEGNIEVTSNIDQGTNFKVCLPLISIENSSPKSSIQDDNALPQILQTQFPILNSSKNHEKSLVLLVEDNTDLQNFLSTGLKDIYRVIIASNGTEGLKLAVSKIPDVIISDVMMPEMNGYEFLTKIKANMNTCHIPVLMLTAKDDRKTKEELLKAGASTFLTKPFYESELLINIHNLIESRSQSWKYFNDTISANKYQTQNFADEKFIHGLTDYILNQITQQTIGVDELCREAKMSRTQLHRKLKAITGYSTGIFIRKVKLDYARQLLERSSLNIFEIAIQTGFNTHSYFSKCFVDEYGLSPKEYVDSLNNKNS